MRHFGCLVPPGCPSPLRGPSNVESSKLPATCGWSNILPPKMWTKRTTKRVIPKLILRCAPILLVGVFTTRCGPLADGDYSLVDGFDQITEQTQTGLYPAFVDAPSATSAVDIEGDTRKSLTPRFPSRFRFELEVPSAAFLEFSPALIMIQNVRRARVEFRIIVGEGGDAVVAYSEILRAASPTVGSTVSSVSHLGQGKPSY